MLAESSFDKDNGFNPSLEIPTTSPLPTPSARRGFNPSLEIPNKLQQTLAYLTAMGFNPSLEIPYSSRWTNTCATRGVSILLLRFWWRPSYAWAACKGKYVSILLLRFQQSSRPQAQPPPVQGFNPSLEIQPPVRRKYGGGLRWFQSFS